MAEPTVVPVSSDLLREALKMPRGVRIVGAEWDRESWSVRLTLEAEGWPPGEFCPTVEDVPRQFVWRDGEREVGRWSRYPLPWHPTTLPVAGEKA